VAPAHATFPGQNGKIAFERFESPTASNYHIFTMNPDGSGQANLLGSAFYDTNPEWSPDGTKLAFTRDAARPNTTGNPDIYSVDADGAGLTQLGKGASPSWSPDGSKIAFTQGGIFQSQIYTMNSDGSGAVNITSSGFGTVDEGPNWSPDGSKIAFTRCLVGGFSHGSIAYSECEIWTMSPDGAGQTNISNSSTLDLNPNWSPDSKKIVFVRAPTQSPFDSQIYTMNADGSGQTRFSKDPSARETTPVWSPDGTKIAFARWVGTNPFHSQIFSVNLDGSGEINLSNGATDDAVPDWQPIPGPQRSDYKNAAKFCKAERDFLGDAAFANKYGGGANAYGKCVSGK
jgi:TolB protein